MTIVEQFDRSIKPFQAGNVEFIVHSTETEALYISEGSNQVGDKWLHRAFHRTPVPRNRIIGKWYLPEDNWLAWSLLSIYPGWWRTNSISTRCTSIRRPPARWSTIDHRISRPLKAESQRNPLGFEIYFTSRLVFQLARHCSPLCTMCIAYNADNEIYISWKFRVMCKFRVFFDFPILNNNNLLKLKFVRIKFERIKFFQRFLGKFLEIFGNELW